MDHQWRRTSSITKRKTNSNVQICCNYYILLHVFCREKNERYLILDSKNPMIAPVKPDTSILVASKQIQTHRVVFQTHSLKTNKCPLKKSSWKTILSFAKAYFRGELFVFRYFAPGFWVNITAIRAGELEGFFVEKNTLKMPTRGDLWHKGDPSGQIGIIPKPELRGFWVNSLTKPPFKVTSAEVVIICPDPWKPSSVWPWWPCDPVSALTLLLSRMLCKSSFSSPEAFFRFFFLFQPHPLKQQGDHWITIYFHRFSTSNCLHK